MTQETLDFGLGHMSGGVWMLSSINVDLDGDEPDVRFFRTQKDAVTALIHDIGWELQSETKDEVEKLVKNPVESSVGFTRWEIEETGKVYFLRYRKASFEEPEDLDRYWIEEE